MGEPKRHHTVPRTYLERFTENDEFLSVYSKFNRKAFRQRAKEATVQQYYYSQPDPENGGRNNKLETGFFYELEEAYPAFRNTLLNNTISTDPEELVTQLLIQRVRSPAFREAFELGLAEYVQRHVKTLPKAGLPKPTKNLPNLYEELAIAIDPHRSIRAMAFYIETFGELLWKLKYSVKRVPKRQTAMTSDNPVIWLDKAEYIAASLIYPSNISRAFTLIYPIDRLHYLIGTPNIGGNPSCCYDERQMSNQFLSRLKTWQTAFAWDKLIGAHKMSHRTLRDLSPKSPSMRIMSYSPENDSYQILDQRIHARNEKHKYEYRPSDD